MGLAKHWVGSSDRSSTVEAVMLPRGRPHAELYVTEAKLDSTVVPCTSDFSTWSSKALPNLFKVMSDHHEQVPSDWTKPCY